MVALVVSIDGGGDMMFGRTANDNVDNDAYGLQWVYVEAVSSWTRIVLSARQSLHVEACGCHFWKGDAPSGIPLDGVAVQAFVAGGRTPFQHVCPEDDHTNGVAPSSVDRVRG
jgi:hypothetical protein